MKALKKKEIMSTEMRASAPSISQSLEESINSSWAKIAPFWPLKNLIAVNPLAGFEDLSFEEGLKQAQAYFLQKDLPQGMQHVNRASIKWLQVYFDEGQSTIQMPLRKKGFLTSLLSLLKFDDDIHKNDNQKIQWLQNLPQQPERIIAESLLNLGIAVDEQEQFFTLMLSTLSGWAAYIQYRTSWADAEDAANPHSVTQVEYLAFRLVLTCLIWPEAKDLLGWHQKALQHADMTKVYDEIVANESAYKEKLLQQFSGIKKSQKSQRSKAQLVFCIDVRSEPFRRSIEAQGEYETFGFAGFFGVPVAIENAVTGECHASCPVLLKPAQTITEHPQCSHKTLKAGHNKLQGLKKLYQSVKYTFSTPFSLVDVMGLSNGLWMGLRSFAPQAAAKIQMHMKSSILSDYKVTPDIKAIPLDQQIAYGAGALKMMGLTDNFAPLVVFCGHGSTTQNNAYATALDCGACGGRHGAPNARILAAILNDNFVRNTLKEKNINIPEDTFFVAAEHNTTTDEVEIYAADLEQEKSKQLAVLQNDLQKARSANSLWRAHEMGVDAQQKNAHKLTALRAQDWAQVRPEWGLARNAAFIVAPRWMTKDMQLDGRCFLHSYDWEQDEDGASLTTILTAPMVVAQWINAQYLFSTLDNVAFGGGSKITKNITGKIGIMQGNASDLMHGLPLQSVLKSDEEAYHKPLRLTVIVHAPKAYIERIIKEQSILQKLFGNGWVHIVCLDPNTNEHCAL